MLDDWQLEIFDPGWGILVIFYILGQVTEVRSTQNLSSEVLVQIFENVMEYLVEVFQDLVEDKLLQSWFQLLEEYGVLNHSSVVLESGPVEVTDTTKNRLGKNHTFPGLIELNEPQID